MKKEFTIKGTHCKSCKALIEDVSKEVPGVTGCTVDFKTGKTIVEYNSSIDWGKFKKEIESLGEYEVKL